MFVYQKKLQYPVRIKNTNPKLAAQIISQYGGPECNRLTYAPFLTKNLSKITWCFFLWTSLTGTVVKRTGLVAGAAI